MNKILICEAKMSELETIQQIAERTWPVAYADILSAEQMRYMLEIMYSLEALQEQLKNGHKFLFASLNGEKIGFASFENNYNNSQNTKLHKLYVLPEKQGYNAGKVMIDAVIDSAKDMDQQKLMLNVNRNNKAVSFYKKIGFLIMTEEDIAIGNNYFMNDFVMELNL